MTAADETQLLRLSDARSGFSEAEAFTTLDAKTHADREAARALIQDMVHRGRLRAIGARWYKVRVAPPEPVEAPRAERPAFVPAPRGQLSIFGAQR